MNYENYKEFEYHTFLHHSQTYKMTVQDLPSFEYHTFLHHSQTSPHIGHVPMQFEYHTFLHHLKPQIQKCSASYALIVWYSNFGNQQISQPSLSII